MPRRDRFASLQATTDPFWGFVRSMLHDRLQFVICIIAAVLSGGMLGVGMVGASPVFDSILGAKKDLPTLMTELNAKIEKSLIFFPWLGKTLQVPQLWIDALPAGQPLVALAWVLGALVVLAIVGAFANFTYSYYAFTIVNKTVAAARQRAFRGALRAPALEVMNNGALDAVSRIVNDSTQMGNGLSTILSKAIIQLLKGVVGFLAALFFSWKVTLVAIVVLPVLYTIIRKLGKRVRNSSERALEGQAQLTATAAEALQGLKVVKSNNAEPRVGARFHRINKTVLKELNRVRTARAIASPLTETLGLLVLCAMVLGVGKAVLTGGLAPKDFVLAIISLAVAGASIKPLTNLAQDIQQATPAARRLRELMLRQPEPGRAKGLPLLPRHAQSIELRNVVVQYEGRDVPALAGVSLHIGFGERVAFVGPNGSGKTTLLSLITRLIEPKSGSLIVDGRDVATFSTRSLRSQIGVVTQEATLFAGTVRDNIAFASYGMTDDAIIGAAKQAGAHDFISKLPLGYDTPIAEQGASLSGGQRQRIAIARALLRNPAILILDEATSMIDTDSEAAISEAIRAFGVDRTVLIVAHRMSTVVQCDRIFVLDKGTIVDCGTHSQLLARCEVYRTLARHQGTEKV